MTSERGFMPGRAHVFAQIALEELHERASFLKVANLFKYEYSWLQHAVDLRGLTKAQTARRIEQLISETLAEAAQDASEAKKTCKAGAKRLEKAVLDVHVTKFDPRPRPEDPNPVASELERVDPVARPVTDLVENVWDWCTGKLGSRRSVLCHIGLYLRFLVGSPIETPKEPKRLFPALEQGAYSGYREPFRHYIHTYRLAESYWQSANAGGDLPAFGAPPGVSWDSLSTFEGLWGMCANVQSWAKQQHAAMPDYLKRSHLSRPSAVGLLLTPEVEAAIRTKVLVVDRSTKTAYCLGTKLHLGHGRFVYLSCWADRPGAPVYDFEMQRQVDEDKHGEPAKVRYEIRMLFGDAYEKFSARPPEKGLT